MGELRDLDVHLQLRDALRYNPETGNFYWHKVKPGRRRVGDLAGFQTAQGYWHVRHSGKNVCLHRVAFLNHPQPSFARSLPPRVAAEGRGLVAPPCGAPATIIHDQMYDDRRAGARSWGCGRHAPVRVSFVRGQVTDLTTSRGLHGSGLFLDLCTQPCRQAVADVLPSHSSAPSLYGINRAAKGFPSVGTAFPEA